MKALHHWEALGRPTWGEVCPRFHWHFAMHAASLPRGRWIKRALEWRPMGKFAPGRPRTTWTTCLEKFARFKRWCDWATAVSQGQMWYQSRDERLPSFCEQQPSCRICAAGCHCLGWTGAALARLPSAGAELAGRKLETALFLSLRYAATQPWPTAFALHSGMSFTDCREGVVQLEKVARSRVESSPDRPKACPWGTGETNMCAATMRQCASLKGAAIHCPMTNRQKAAMQIALRRRLRLPLPIASGRCGPSPGTSRWPSRARGCSLAGQGLWSGRGSVLTLVYSRTILIQSINTLRYLNKQDDACT